jgi:hypothetical protein
MSVAQCILSLSEKGGIDALSEEEYQAFRVLSFVSSCYLKIRTPGGELTEIELNRLRSLHEHGILPPSPPSSVSETPITTPSRTPVVSAIQSFRVHTIQQGRCMARKKNGKISDTHPIVYAEKQCAKLVQKGARLCDKCYKMQPCIAREDKKEWHGCVDEGMPEKSPFVGSTWFKQRYPNGLPSHIRQSVRQSIPSLRLTPVHTPVHVPEPEPQQQQQQQQQQRHQTHTQIPIHTNIPTIQTSKPQSEYVTLQKTLAKPQWICFQEDDVYMIRNVKSGRVYRADLTKKGNDIIQMQEYIGRWKNSSLDLSIQEFTDDDEDIDE